MSVSDCCRKNFTVIRGDKVCDACGGLCEEYGSTFRKPLGIAAVQDSGSDWLYVVCDDGTVWITGPGREGWDQIDPIPGTIGATRYETE